MKRENVDGGGGGKSLKLTVPWAEKVYTEAACLGLLSVPGSCPTEAS